MVQLVQSRAAQNAGGMPPGGMPGPGAGAPGGIPHGMIPGPGVGAPGMPPGMGGQGPGRVAPPGMGSQPPVTDPALAHELASLKGQVAGMQGPLADYQLGQQMNEAGRHYQDLQKHFGEALPADFEAMRPDVLAKYKDIVEGRVPPHLAAAALAALEKATAGDGTMRDRLIAAAAKANPQPPAVEGKGGAIAGNTATGEPLPQTAAERLRALKRGWDTLNSQAPGV